MSSIEKKWGTELEICVDSIESAVVAAKSGATRLELCSALSEGGLTPSVGLFRAIMRLVSIPIFVLIRPRRGDFCYSDDEIQAMCDDISILKKEGAVGFVLGALTVNGSIDKPAMKRLISAARSDSGLEHPKNVSLTFHRAIDMVPDPLSCVADIIELGMDRILSSGGKSTAYEGALVLKAMVKKAGDSCIIMAGAGITADNIAYISEQATVRAFHGSFRRSYPSPFMHGSVATATPCNNDNNNNNTSCNDIAADTNLYQSGIEHGKGCNGGFAKMGTSADDLIRYVTDGQQVIAAITRLKTLSVIHMT